MFQMDTKEVHWDAAYMNFSQPPGELVYLTFLEKGASSFSSENDEAIKNFFVEF